MSTVSFSALLVAENPDKTFSRRIADREIDALPAGDVLVRVRWSSLNYKDALSATGNRGVTRSYPHTPGIDAAGVVEHDATGRFAPGAEVIVTSYDLGMNTPGGFGQYIRVPAGWVVPLPAGLGLRQAMEFGTAGLTAAIAVWQLQRNGISADLGEVLVTGATGGVGSLAVAILARAGYAVVAATGKADQADYLRGLGAARVIPREEVNDASPRPMLGGKWAGAVDTVGGNVLATVIRQLKLGGAVAALGNVGGPDLHTTVFPFILRGVSLLGVDSGNLPLGPRAALWGKLAGEWKPAPETLAAITRVCALEALDERIDAILRGAIAGHVLVDLG